MSFVTFAVLASLVGALLLISLAAEAGYQKTKAA
jgi:hypothetical protein